MGQSKAHGVGLMAKIVRGALYRYKGRGPILNAAELNTLANSLAAVNSTADLLGRVRVRERAERAGNKFLDQSQDAPFSTFAEGDAPGVMATPEAALDYFLSIRPELAVTVNRYAGQQRRHAFTLAASASEALTARVQKIVAESLQRNKSVADAQAGIRRALEAAGVSPKNPQYSEMVYRTNAMDSFQTGMYEEGRADDVAAAFPVWEYLIVDDDRTGEDHRPKGGKYFPAKAAFAEVRGPRPFNCRCSLRWVDSGEWEKLQGRGARVEDRW